MPAPIQDVYITPSKSAQQFDPEAVFNNLHSLMLLAKSEKISGLGAWIGETAAAMNSEEKERHRLVMHGLYYAIRPEESWPTFRDYLDYLESVQPEVLQENLLSSYASCSFKEQKQAQVEFDRKEVLSDFDSYLTFLKQCFDQEHINRELEAQAFSYLSDPPRLKELVHSHLNHMWERYLRDEWNRSRPIIMEAITAFQQVDFDDMDKFEAFEFITGRAAPESWEEEISEIDQIIYIPSTHMGPYLGLIEMAEGMGVIFGARLPEGAEMSVPDLSRAEILVRLSALADDTRLQILKLSSESGELRSKDIVQTLNLSQSAASRHLSQLSATGYLAARRCEGSKCYTINSEKIKDTLNAVSAFLSAP